MEPVLFFLRFQTMLMRDARYITGPSVSGQGQQPAGINKVSGGPHFSGGPATAKPTWL